MTIYINRLHIVRVLHSTLHLSDHEDMNAMLPQPLIEKPESRRTKYFVRFLLRLISSRGQTLHGNNKLPSQAIFRCLNCQNRRAKVIDGFFFMLTAMVVCPGMNPAGIVKCVISPAAKNSLPHGDYQNPFKFSTQKRQSVKFRSDNVTSKVDHFHRHTM